jgi:hypothetical protein
VADVPVMAAGVDVPEPAPVWRVRVVADEPEIVAFSASNSANVFIYAAQIS